MFRLDSWDAFVNQEEPSFDVTAAFEVGVGTETEGIRLTEEWTVLQVGA